MSPAGQRRGADLGEARRLDLGMLPPSVLVPKSRRACVTAASTASRVGTVAPTAGCLRAASAATVSDMWRGTASGRGGRRRGMLQPGSRCCGLLELALRTPRRCQGLPAPASLACGLRLRLVGGIDGFGLNLRGRQLQLPYGRSGWCPHPRRLARWTASRALSPSQTHGQRAEIGIL